MSTVSNSNDSDCWCSKCEPDAANKSSGPQLADPDELLEGSSSESDLSEASEEQFRFLKKTRATIEAYLALSHPDEGQRLESKELHEVCDKFVESSGSIALIPLDTLYRRVDYRLRFIRTTIGLLKDLDISTKNLYLTQKSAFGGIQWRKISSFEEFDSSEELLNSTAGQNDCIWDFYHELKNWPLLNAKPESLDAMDQLWDKPRFYLAFVLFTAKVPREEMKRLWREGPLRNGAYVEDPPQPLFF